MGERVAGLSSAAVVAALVVAAASIGCASPSRRAEAAEVKRNADDARSTYLLENEAMLRRITELEEGQAPRAEMGLSQRRLGTLRFGSAVAGFSAVRDANRLSGRIAHNRLRSDDSSLRVDHNYDEWDGAVELKRPLSDGAIHARVGGNIRRGDSLPYAQFVWERRTMGRGRGRFEVYLNELSEDSSALRAIGAKDKLVAAYSANIASRESATVRLSGQRYHTRDNEHLAHGVRLDAEAASVLSRNSPVFVVRAYGSWQKNRLANSLPRGLQALPSDAGVSSVIPSDYRMLAVGATVRTGQSERRPQAYAETAAGASWPQRRFTLQLRIGASTPVRGGDVVSLDAFYANAPGAGTDESYSGIELQYRARF